MPFGKNHVVILFMVKITNTFLSKKKKITYTCIFYITSLVAIIRKSETQRLLILRIVPVPIFICQLFVFLQYLGFGNGLTAPWTALSIWTLSYGEQFTCVGPTYEFFTPYFKSAIYGFSSSCCSLVSSNLLLFLFPFDIYETTVKNVFVF